MLHTTAAAIDAATTTNNTTAAATTTATTTTTTTTAAAAAAVAAIEDATNLFCGEKQEHLSLKECLSGNVLFERHFCWVEL